MNDRTYLTPTEVCTLIAHEAVVLLDAVETEVPSCVSEFRTALETLNAVHTWAATARPCCRGWTRRSPTPNGSPPTAPTCPT